MSSVGVMDGIVLNSGLEGKSYSYQKKCYQRYAVCKTCSTMQTEEFRFVSFKVNISHVKPGWAFWELQVGSIARGNED